MVIRLAFQRDSKHFSIWAWLIKIWTNSPYFHVELIIDDKWITSNFDIGGVSVRKLRPFKDTWEYINVEVDEKYLPDVWEFIYKEEGSKYDWCGIVCAQIIGLNHHTKSRWFCSEFVTQVLKTFNHPDYIDVNPVRMTPGDIYMKSTKDIRKQQKLDNEIERRR